MELKTLADSFESDVQKRTKDLPYICDLPLSGLKKNEILEVLKKNLNLSK